MSLTATTRAHADPSSWLAFGGGYGIEHDSYTRFNDRAPVFSATLGVGSSPRAKIVAGGVLRMVTYFSLGTDLGLAARVATGGFARGDWGVALDAGPVARWWDGGNKGRYPIQTVLTLGLPWGLQVAGGAQLWNIAGAPNARGGFAALELDFLRFTVMRQGSTESSWPNPAPAGGRDAAFLR